MFRTNFLWCSLVAWFFCVTLAIIAYESSVSLVPQKMVKYEASSRLVEVPRNRTRPRTLPVRNIFYNRIPKCGSRSLLNIVRRLSRQNNFIFAASPEFGRMRPGVTDMLKEMRKIASLETPTFYNRHIHFLDFDKYGYRKPIYLNLIRDPIDRFTSNYNYLKYGDSSTGLKEKPPEMYRLDINECVMKGIGVCNRSLLFVTGKYFCGFNNLCRTPTKASAKLAKKHIDESYAVIGMTEEFENSVRLFERALPEYFSGALDDWKGNFQEKNHTASYRLDVLNENAREKLRTRGMVYEYEVYNHVKRKFKMMKKKYGIL